MLQDIVAWFSDPANWQGEDGLVNRLVEHGLLTVTATLVAVLLGLPLALWLGHVGKGGLLAVNVSNMGRAVPTFAVLLFLALGPIGTAYFGPFGRAGLATLVALVLFALPPIITNAYVAVREVPADVRQAADGMGMTGLQKFGRVELPLALPLVMSGVRLALVQVWATATIAALVAGPGLGRVITDGFFRSNYAKGIAGAVVVAAVALVLELVAGTVQRAVDPTPAAPSRRRGRGKQDPGRTVGEAAEPVGS